MIHVCIIEDLPEIRAGLMRLITNQPNMTLSFAVETAEEAIPLLIEKEPDIAIMDINLPGINGIDCIRKVKDQCPETQFMIFTIYENDEKVFDALAAGASGYILKKTPNEKVIDAIADLYQGGSPMSGQIARKVIGYFNEKKTPAHESLTKKENEILLLLSKGFLYKEVAFKLEITIGTVTQHIHHIYEKLHVSNKTEAINKVYGSK
jgi:DNA-binding NarL/FixJ family response regulator